MERFLAWLAALPAAGLYATLGLAALLENVVPPLPSDVVIAFGTFALARGGGNGVTAFLCTWAGSVAGAMLMYFAGRRWGAERLAHRLMRGEGDAARARLQSLFDRWGVWAIVVSRFLPGVRAVVPPFAGAMRLAPARALLAMALPSAVWYGAITWLAFRAGAADWQALSAQIREGQRWVGIGAGVVAVLIVIGFVLFRRRGR